MRWEKLWGLAVFFSVAFAQSSPSSLLPSRILTSLQNEIAVKIKTQKISAPSYFFILFAYQDPRNTAQDSHSFASFVRVDAYGNQKWSTISWLPADFRQKKQICVFKDINNATWRRIAGDNCRAVNGRNHSLAETLQWALEAPKSLALWGPFRISKDFYELGKERVAFLNAGGVGYLPDDFAVRKSFKALNCMHAISDFPPFFSKKGGLFGTGFGIWGIKGSQHVLKHLMTAEKDFFYDPVKPSQYRRFDPQP